MLEHTRKWEHKGPQVYRLNREVPGVEPEVLQAAVDMLIHAGAYSASAGFVRKAALSPDLQVAFEGLRREALVTADGDGFRFSIMGQRALVMQQRLHNPVQLFRLDKNKPLGERSAFALFHVLEEHISYCNNKE